MTPEQFEQQLIDHEGMELKMYQCPAGYLTIGVGHNLEAKAISEEAALQILRDDVSEFATELGEAIPWVRNLDSTRYYVLLNMAFNLGTAGLLAFRKTLMLVENGKYEAAADEMLDSRWANQVGRRATELSQMMRTGVYGPTH